MGAVTSGSTHDEDSLTINTTEKEDLNVRLPVDLLARLAHHRIRLECSVEELVERALTDWVREEDRTESLMGAFDEIVAQKDL